jgi:hypothetical protein
MAFNPAKTRTWKDGRTPATGTQALGSLFDAEFNQLYENDNYLKDKLVPVGAIIPWVPGYFADGNNGSYTGVSITLSGDWKECDGSVLNDADSPIFNGAGRYLPNLTDDRFLMGDISGNCGDIGGANDGHYHGMGTGADLNITASGSHFHQLETCTTGSTFSSNAIARQNNPFNQYVSTELNTHTHSSGDFAGRIGLITGGFDGNAAGSNIPKYLACRYLMRVK